MTPDALFVPATAVASVAWLLLIASPGEGTTRRVRLAFVPLLLSLLYLAVLTASTRSHQGNFLSLDGVRALFTNEWALLAGWIHFLAFDLLVGVWMSRDAEERGVPRWLVAPFLLLTFLLGPLGFLGYHLVRPLLSKQDA